MSEIRDAFLREGGIIFVVMYASTTMVHFKNFVESAEMKKQLKIIKPNIQITSPVNTSIDK